MAPRAQRVEARVEDGDGEPPRVERAGQVHHRVDVALERQWEHQRAAAPGLPAAGHRRVCVTACSAGRG